MERLVLLLALALSLGGSCAGQRFQEVDPSREDVKEAAAFAVTTMNEEANSLYADMVLKVTRATAQVRDTVL